MRGADQERNLFLASLQQHVSMGEPLSPLFSLVSACPVPGKFRIRRRYGVPGVGQLHIR